MQKIKFDVLGMTCSSCQAHVEKAVKKLDGVNVVNVNLLSNNMIVEFDENKISENEIIEAVIGAGYDAKVTIKGKNISNENNKTKIDENILKMKKRLVLSFLFLIPLMYIAMFQMLNHMFKIPIPSFIINLYTGTENALRLALTELVLLIPIIILNRNYFIIGFKRLFKKSPNMDSLIAMGSSAATAYGLFAIYMIITGLKSNNFEQVETYMKDLYFESAGTILTLITFGKYLETKSKGKTSDAISKLINLVPKTATVIRNEKEVEIPVEEIKEEEIVLIRPGSNIPVDGVIIYRYISC